MIRIKRLIIITTLATISTIVALTGCAKKSVIETTSESTVQNTEEYTTVMQTEDNTTETTIETTTETLTLATESLKLKDAKDKREAYMNLAATINYYLPGIVGWGDSLTVGMGSSYGYMEVLKQLIDENILYNTGCTINMAMMGIGGEDSKTIAARAGGIELMVTSDFTIPVNSTPALFSFSSTDGDIIEVGINGNTGIEYVEIEGVRGYLTYLPNPEYTADTTGSVKNKYVYYFNRLEEGEAKNIVAGTKMLTQGYIEYSNYFPIVFMGENGGYADEKDLYNQQMAIVNAGREKDRYVIVGITSGTAAQRESMEITMQQLHGEKYVNARQLISSYGAAMTGTEITVFDQWMIDEGQIPGRLLSDSVHFNEAGYRALGMIIYDNMVKNGYFDEIKAAADEYRKY